MIASGRKMVEFNVDMTKVEGFRYRVEDAFRAVTKVAIKEARLKELKKEILASEKLKSHFEDNPHDLEALRHDRFLFTAKVQTHLKHVPIYLMPSRKRKVAATGADESNAADVGQINFKTVKKKKRPAPKATNGKKGKNDPLKSFRA